VRSAAAGIIASGSVFRTFVSKFDITDHNKITFGLPALMIIGRQQGTHHASHSFPRLSITGLLTLPAASRKRIMHACSAIDMEDIRIFGADLHLLKYDDITCTPHPVMARLGHIPAPHCPSHENE
jgi:hypothetical protein